jgi:hypothetical protein
VRQDPSCKEQVVEKDGTELQGNVYCNMGMVSRVCINNHKGRPQTYLK